MLATSLDLLIDRGPKLYTLLLEID